MMSYTTRDELTSALESIRQGVQERIIEEGWVEEWTYSIYVYPTWHALTYLFFLSDITDEVIAKSSQLRTCRPLDVMVRTSGEVRLSDFMVWQAAHSGALFACFNTNWPAFSFWHLAAAVLQFQFNVVKSGLPLSVASKVSSLVQFRRTLLSVEKRITHYVWNMLIHLT